MKRVAGIATLLLGLLLVANVPLYAGATYGRFSWRLEHGRLTLENSAVNRSKPFWIAPNAEGLRWLPEGEHWSLDEWTVTLPLWIPLVVCLTGWLALRRRSGARSN